MVERRPVLAVERRDGRREPFDPRRLATSIHRAALAVGQGETLLAEELAALVGLVLEEELGGGIPTTTAVREMVERVLMETGHHDVARSYILRHAREADAAPDPSARAGKSSAGVPLVASLGRECIERFDAARLASGLMVECGLAAADASTIAAAVEAKLLRVAEPIAATTIRLLVAAELQERARQDLLPRVQGLGLPASEIEAVACAGGGGEPAARLGAELLRRHALARLLDPPVAAAHLRGDVHVDGLCGPGHALEATIDFSEVRRAALPGALAGLLQLVHGLEPALLGPLALHHVERALVPAIESRAELGEVARTLLLALSSRADATGAPPRRVLGFAADLPGALATALFRRGAEPEAIRGNLQRFAIELLEQGVALAGRLALPRLRLLVDAGDEERGLVPLSAALQPALALGLADVAHATERGPAVRVIGARIGLNVARRGLAAGRRRERELLRSLPDLVERGLSAGANVLRHLLQRDELGLGFLRRLRDLARDLGRELPLELPGSHAYEIVLVPVGVDAAVRAVTEREPSESEPAARFRDELLETLRSAVPQHGATRFTLLEQRFQDAELRFGRLDWIEHPRGRDVLGLAHDGAAFRYSFDPTPPAMAMAAAVAGGLEHPARSFRQESRSQSRPRDHDEVP